MPSFAAAFLLALLFVSAARADGGEAGLVVDFGNGDVRTFCIPFSGDGISGDQLLAAAGLDTNVLGQSAGKVVCSIDDVGCTHSGSFESCMCQCQGSTCRYWAFFTQKYGGAWTYSALAVNRVVSKDGDMQAWKWGVGSPASAPVPGAATFEQVCGHPPQASQAATPTATQPPATTSPGTSVPPAPGTAQASVTAAGATPPLTSIPATAASPESRTVTVGPASSPPATPAGSIDDHDDDSDGGNTGLVAFGVVVVLLGAAIGVAAIWRRRRGA